MNGSKERTFVVAYAAAIKWYGICLSRSLGGCCLPIHPSFQTDVRIGQGSQTRERRIANVAELWFSPPGAMGVWHSKHSNTVCYMCFRQYFNTERPFNWVLVSVHTRAAPNQSPQNSRYSTID